MFQGNIEKIAKENNNFRQVIYTSQFSQLVVMSLKPQEEIGEEIHNDNDQILIAVEGEGIAVIDGVESRFAEDEVVFVPAGTKHNFINNGDEDLKIYTIYAPPAHADGTVHVTKAEAEQDESDHY